MAWLDRGTEHPHRIALSARVDVVQDIMADLEAAIGRSSNGSHGLKVRPPWQLQTRSRVVWVMARHVLGVFVCWIVIRGHPRIRCH